MPEPGTPALASGLLTSSRCFHGYDDDDDDDKCLKTNMSHIISKFNVQDKQLNMSITKIKSEATPRAPYVCNEIT